MKKIVLYISLMLCFCSSCTFHQEENSQAMSDDSLYASLDSIVTSYYNERGFNAYEQLDTFQNYWVLKLTGLTLSDITKIYGDPDSDRYWENVDMTRYQDDMYLRKMSKILGKYRKRLTIYECFWDPNEDNDYYLWIPFVKINKEWRAVCAERINKELFMME